MRKIACEIEMHSRLGNTEMSLLKALQPQLQFEHGKSGHFKMRSEQATTLFSFIQKRVPFGEQHGELFRNKLNESSAQ